MNKTINYHFIENKFSLYLIGFLPLSLLIGTLFAEIIIFIIIFFFLYEIILERNFNFLKNTLFIFFLIVYVYLIINLFNSSNFNLSFNRSIFFLRFPLLVMAIAYFIKKNKFEINLIYKLWTITICIIIFDLYFQYIFGFNMLGFKSPWPERLSGFLGDELKIANLLIGFATHVIIFNFLKNKNIKIFYFFLFSYLIILFLVNERSNALKGLFIIFFLYLLINEINIKQKIILLIAIVGLVFSLINFSNSLNQRFFVEIKKMKIQENNLMEYIIYSNYGPHYLAGIEIFKKKPYLGSGIKTFRKICEDVDLNKYYKNKNYKYLANKKCSTHPHQLHIEILSELGIIGYSLFILLFFYLIFKSLKIYFKHKNSLILSPLFFIIAQFIPLLPSGSFFTNFGATIFWINVGLIYSEILKYE